MFPLAGKDFPESSEDLESAIGDALADVFTLPAKSAGVSVGGGKFPDLKTVTLDLDGASVKMNGTPPPKPLGVGKRKPGIAVGKLEVSGHTIRYGRAKLDLDLTAKSLTFDFDRDKKSHPLLVLTDAKEGRVVAKIGKTDLEALLLEAVTAAAEPHGVKIQDLVLELTSDGPQSVAADVRVRAKKMIMTGIVHVTGRLEVDKELNATVSDLNCKGEGVIGSAAAGYLQRKITPFDGTTLALMTFSLGDVTLRDLKIKLTDSLQVTAAFGSD